jgi:DNA-directed RNA polymerase subunit M/transcription elongation factor TFIIS
MSFCPTCEKSTTRETLNGVEFICSCGTIMPGDAYSVRIKTFSINTGQMAAEINQQFIKNAPFDKANNLIKEKCEGCGRLYKSQVRIGDSETIIKGCKCGHK